MLTFTNRPRTESRSYHLDAASIDLISEWIDETLSGSNVPTRDILRLRLTAEEALGIWGDTLGSDSTCVCETVFNAGRRMMILKCPGRMVNPCNSKTISPYISDVPNIISALGMTTEYSFHGGCNILKITQPQKQKKFSALPVAIAAAVCTGLGLRFGAPSVGAALLSEVITPIFDTLLRILGVISGPMIFLSLISGIIGIGSPKTLGQIGSKLLSAFGIGYLFSSALSILFGVILYPVSAGESTNGSSASVQIRDMLLDIVPSNIMDPFRTGNALQIIFMAACVGIAILALGGTVTVLADTLCQLGIMVQLIMSNVGKLMPLFIFVSLLSLILDDNVNDIAGILLPLLGTTAACLIWLFLNILRLSRKYHTPAAQYIRILMPTFLVGVTTASSTAAFQTNIDVCRDKLHMDESMIHFGLSMGQVLYAPGTQIGTMLMVFGIAHIYQVPITPVWIITAAIVSIVISAASPPVAGGMLSTTAILFAQLGIPESGLALAVSYLLIADFIQTAANMVSLIAVMYAGTPKAENEAR